MYEVWIWATIMVITTLWTGVMFLLINGEWMWLSLSYLHCWFFLNCNWLLCLISLIRFELPYNIWCGGCGAHVGMGVRYNAQKTTVGRYYSTPIFKFRMKCHLCDNHFEIQTDPKVGHVIYELTIVQPRLSRHCQAQTFHWYTCVQGQ